MSSSKLLAYTQETRACGEEKKGVPTHLSSESLTRTFDFLRLPSIRIQSISWILIYSFIFPRNLQLFRKNLFFIYITLKYGHYIFVEMSRIQYIVHFFREIYWFFEDKLFGDSFEDTLFNNCNRLHTTVLEPDFDDCFGQSKLIRNFSMNSTRVRIRKMRESSTFFCFHCTQHLQRCIVLVSHRRSWRNFSHLHCYSGNDSTDNDNNISAVFFFKSIVLTLMMLMLLADG